MTFAKLTYRIAAIWGFAIMVPMYFLYNFIGRSDPPALSHPHFYFGWLGVTIAWQVLFFILSTDPARYRPMMLAAVLEKLGFVLAVCILLSLKMVNGQEAITALPDAIWMGLFVVAYVKTAPFAQARSI